MLKTAFQHDCVTCCNHVIFDWSSRFPFICHQESTRRPLAADKLLDFASGPQLADGVTGDLVIRENIGSCSQ